MNEKSRASKKELSRRNSDGGRNRARLREKAAAQNRYRVEQGYPATQLRIQAKEPESTKEKRMHCRD